MAKRKKTTKKGVEKEQVRKKEVCEIFNVSRNGREETIESCRIEKNKKEHTANNSGKKEDKQIFYAVVIMAAVLALFFISYIIFQQSKKFEYNGFKFEKIVYDKLPLYYTKIPITRSDGSSVNYNLYLRNDPRKLEANVKSDAFVRFMKGAVFISLNRNFEQCDDTNLAMTNMGMLFGALAFEAQGALNNASEAESLNRPYVTCENTKGNTVVLYKEANETSIIQKDNCYVINVANCEILNVTEAFIMQTLSDMARIQDIKI